MNQHERAVLISTCYGHFMSHFNMLVFPALVLPLSSRLGMEMAAVLSLSFWMYLLFGVTALPWGLAADRFGSRPFLFLFYLGSALCAFAAALMLDNPKALALCLAGLGFFSGIYHPIGLGLISKEIKRISVGMGYNGMFGNLGLGMSPLLTGLVNWLWGAQAAYWVLGSLNLAGIGLMLRFRLTESRQQHHAAGESDATHILPFLILLVAMMLGGIVYRGVTVVLPSYFELRNMLLFQWISSWLQFGISTNLVATTTTSVIFIVGMVGQYAGGQVAEKYELKRAYLFFHASAIPLAFLMAFTGDMLLVLVAFCYFFFLLGMQPIENTLVAKFTPRKFHHSAYGTKFVLTFGVGALAVKMVEAIQTHQGLPAVFPGLGMVSVVLVGAILLLMFNTRRQTAVS